MNTHAHSTHTVQAYYRRDRQAARKHGSQRSLPLTNEFVARAVEKLQIIPAQAYWGVWAHDEGLGLHGPSLETCVAYIVPRQPTIYVPQLVLRVQSFTSPLVPPVKFVVIDTASAVCKIF